MKPRLVWGTFAACLAVVAAAMAWTTAIGLRLERADRAARAQAALEENTRLALWRIDSTVTPLLAQESARPYFQYGPYYDAGAAYARMHNPTSGSGLAPSPLLKNTPPSVLLHFQVAPGGAVTSPEVPAGALRSRALAEGQTTRARLAEGSARLGTLAPIVAKAPVWRAVATQPIPRPPSPSPLQALMPQKAKSVREYEQRAQNVLLNQSIQRDPSNAIAFPPLRASIDLHAADVVEEAPLAPLWLGSELLLARQVRIDGTSYAQACWLDWPTLRSDLLATVADLLPHARLEPVGAEPGADDERRLATLPVRLVPGALAPPPDERSVVRLSLAGAWAGLAVAALAVALLLRSVMALSERRRTFVSAVTHELRTPLTTFRLYTDMMAEGMVPGEEKRKEYVERLRVEAHRLGHLVENVLAYARLENRRPAAARERVDLRELVRGIVERVSDRVRRSGLALVLDPGDGAPVPVRVDASVVEQVLVNLVDNACKYARPSEPATIDVRVSSDGASARLRVRDHGPGLSDTARRRLFRPFSKSDREAADSAPGLGLGLALCRDLARAQGGDVALDQGVADGAAFVLTLPLEQAG
jgi:signal transduction histidine kinase